MKHPVIIMDFTGVYRNETFFKYWDFEWIDCTNINNVKYLCDKEGRSAITRKIEKLSPVGIHFIDSGNFHYISKFWTDKIKEPFLLIVFDHHPDMQNTLFPELLSCGCWVKDVLDTNKYVQKVILVGVKDSLTDQIPDNYRNRVRIFNESSLRSDSLRRFFKSENMEYPVFVSIDKDVLRSEEAVTDWENGSMRLAELVELLEVIVLNNKIIGVDVCGECSNTLDMISRNNIYQINDEGNRSILSHLLDLWDADEENDEELFPHIDPEGGIIGKAGRKVCHSGSKLLHPVVHLHVRDSSGRLYLQKRSVNKDIQPGKWDTSVGGHVSLGESVIDALRREAQEELGIIGFVPEFVDKYIFESDIEKELIHVYTTEFCEKINPDRCEVERGAFFSKEEIQSMIRNGITTPNFASEYLKYGAKIDGKYPTG